MTQAAKGFRDEPREILRRAVRQDPKNYRAWLWLAHTAETIEEKRAALYNTMLLIPDNKRVVQAYQDTLRPAHIQAAAEQGAFMCYSRSDELFAVEMAERIKERNLPVWIDMLDVPIDADWNDAISDALDRCGVMLLVLSPGSVNGEDTRAEVAHVLQMGKPVVPLLYQDCDYKPLNLVHPAIDFRENALSGLRMVFALLGILQTGVQ